MRYLLVFTLIISVFSCKKSPIEPEIVHEEYTIEGVFYDKDGVTPLSNYPLELLAEIEQPFSSGSQFEYPASTTTDEKGYFKLTYRGNDNYTKLDLGQPASKTPVYGPFLTKIPLNQNISRNVSLIENNHLKLSLSIGNTINSKDSLFIHTNLGAPLEDSLFNLQINNGSLNLILVTQNSYNQVKSWSIPAKTTKKFNGQDRAIRWGIGKSNFSKAGDLGMNEKSNSRLYGILKYTMLSFPDTTRVSLTLQ